jgi:hypothetical protein
MVVDEKVKRQIADLMVGFDLDQYIENHPERKEKVARRPRVVFSSMPSCCEACKRPKSGLRSVYSFGFVCEQCFDALQPRDSKKTCLLCAQPYFGVGLSHFGCIHLVLIEIVEKRKVYGCIKFTKGQVRRLMSSLKVLDIPECSAGLHFRSCVCRSCLNTGFDLSKLPFKIRLG